MQRLAKCEFWGCFTEKNGFYDEIEWHHNFLRFLKARKFPIVAIHIRGKFGTHF